MDRRTQIKRYTMYPSMQLTTIHGEDFAFHAVTFQQWFYEEVCKPVQGFTKILLLDVKVKHRL